MSQLARHLHLHRSREVLYAPLRLAEEFCQSEHAFQLAARALHRLFTLAGVPEAHPHRFRDTFAVEMLLAGVLSSGYRYCPATAPFGLRKSIMRLGSGPGRNNSSSMSGGLGVRT